jgi:hypothetical protein
MKLSLATGISPDELEMDINRLFELLEAWPLRKAVWLFPLAAAFHVPEEAPHFAHRASKHALPGYTLRRWRRIHGLGMVFAIAFCALARFSEPLCRLPLLCSLPVRERPEWLVPCKCDVVL